MDEDIDQNLGDEGNDVDVMPQDEVDDQEREAQKKRERITTRYMTKYERARVLGTRALQIRYEFGQRLIVYAIFNI
jgi:DNA-directed RNA polymerase I, II, and III subunit RPABC2